MYTTIFGDQPARHKSHLCSIVIDHIILIFSTGHQLTIYKYPFGTGQYNKVLLPVIALQFIRPLVALYPLENIAGKLPLGHRAVKSNTVLHLVCFQYSTLISQALYPFIVIEKIACRPLHIIISGGQFMSALFKGHIHFIKLL
ncbi:hypothetical protein D3C72_1039090 [compost metagenome]